MSSDNPIDNIISNVLGLSQGPKSFSEKIDNIAKAAGLPRTELHYIDFLRLDNKQSSLISATKASTQLETNTLYGKLYKAGLIPEEAYGVFMDAPSQGADIFFDEMDKGLYYRSKQGGITSLPVRSPHGAVSFSGRARKVNTLLKGSAITPFIDLFYSSIGSDVQASAKEFLDSGMSKVLMEGVDTRGIYTPESAFWTSRLSILDQSSVPGFSEHLNNFHLYSSNFAMLTKTGGRMITPELEARIGKVQNIGSARAFDIIKGYKADYIDELKKLYTASGNPSSYVFTKPEYLGDKEKILMPSSQLTSMYGSRFEERTLKKGLFQLAKLKATDQGLAYDLLSKGIDPSAPFVTSARGTVDMFHRMGLRVGVVDTADNAAAMLLFQDGGAVLSPTGAAKFAQRAPMGSLSFSSPSEELIGAVERSFGINLGKANTQTFSDLPSDQLVRATLQDYKILRNANPSQSGLLKKLHISGNKLAKVSLTDSELTLDFVTSERITPHTSEINIGGGRFSAIQLDDRSILKGAIPSKAMEGIDVFISAEDFNKLPNVQDAYITNFIEQVQQRDDAAEIFRRTFKQEAHVAMSGKTRIMVPMVTNADTAFMQAQRMTRQMLRGNKQQRALAAKIERGNRVTINSGFSKAIKGVRVFGLGGASRTDFLVGDINMMKPVVISPTKMLHMAAGAKSLGYNTAYEDPMFSILGSMSSSWRNQQIGVTSSGQLLLGEDHIMKRYSKALLAEGATPKSSSVITLGSEGGFFKDGKPLRSLPNNIDAFSHGKGGVEEARLKGTLLDTSEEMLYLDLGKHKTLNLLGTKGGERGYRYLPIPIKYLRAKEGVHGRIVIGQSHPTHGLLKSLIGIESNRDFYKDPVAALETDLAKGYFDLNKAISGKKGIFQTADSIVMPLGTRARLTPQTSNYFDMSSFTDTSKLYTTQITPSDFNDYLLRKSGMGKAVRSQIASIRKQAYEKGYFYAMVNVDPMQRAEHANIQKVILDKQAKPTKGIGQLNLNMHPFWYLMTERDTDRDAVSFVPMSGVDLGDVSPGQIDSLLEKRWIQQQKLSSHFMWFYKHQLMTGEMQAPAHKRFSGIRKKLKKARDAVEHIGEYIGISKSLGYSTVRASEPIMSELISNGIEGARAMGLKPSKASDTMLEAILAPFKDDPIRYEAANKMFQNLYQGAVQKGSRSPLEAFDEKLVEIGQRYKAGAFDYERVVDDVAKELEVLLQDASKVRSFTDLDYLYKNFSGVRESMDAMKADLERGAEYSLDVAKNSKDNLIRAQARMMAEVIGPGQVLVASQAIPHNVNRIAQFVADSKTTANNILKSIIHPAAGTKQGSMNLGDEAATEAAENLAGKITKAAAPAAEAEGTILNKVSKFLGTSHGKHFGMGLGIGALVGAGIVSTMSGPEAPMPREVDGRQPTDIGPEIYSTPPRLYGNAQMFSASRRRSPEVIGQPAQYNFPGFSESSMTIRDRRGFTDSHMIDRHMRDISRSDYVY